MTDPTPTEPYAPPSREPSAEPHWGPQERHDAPAAASAAAKPSSVPVSSTRAIAVRSGPTIPDIVFGLLFIAIGLWLFADVSLGLDLPRVRWGDLWPVALIALGAWVLLGAMRRR